MTNLPEVGARAVVENMPKYQAAMDAVNKALEKAGMTAEKAAKRSGAMTKAYEAMGKAAKTAERVTSAAMTGIAAKVATIAASVVAAIGTVVTIIAVALVAAIGVAITAVGAFVGALTALAGRGANYEGIIESFERLTSSVQISANALYDDLRTAAKGTIPDLQLLRLTNMALAGASGEAGKMFGESLPRLLEIARAQARATGQSVEYLFESLITGIKRGSPLLIDNTGLMLKVGEANEAYAESIGKTVEQLTAQEQQMALLHATLEAGEQMLATYGDASETLATKLERARTSITNTLDYLAIAVQPVAKAIMDSVNSVLTGIANFTRQAVPYLQAIGQLIVRAIEPILRQIAGIGEQLNSPDAARSFFSGAVNTFGAFLRGVVMTGVRIIQAVANIANAIADFLIGQSPPPRGPLSKIDQGGANVMLAWLDGMIGGFSLDPVERVAQQVADALGPVAAMALQQVEARLAQLDAALKPFQDRLSIVKAEFDAIAKIGDIAFQRIERQLTTAVQALVRGEAGSGATVRALDAQRAAIEAALEAQRQNTEEYELQLAMAEAMQARERALLSIRKSQLPTLEAAAKTVKKTATEAAGKEKKGSGSADLPEVPGEPFASAPLENLFGIGGDPGDIKKAMSVMEQAWRDGFGDAGELWAEAQAGLRQGSDRLTKGFNYLPTRIADSLQGAFGPLATTVQKHLLAAEEHIRLFTETTVPDFFTSLPGNIGLALSGLGGQLELYLISPIRDKINTYIAPLFADSATPGSIAYFFAQIPTQIQTALTSLEEWVNTYLVEPVKNKVNDVQAAFNDFFNGEGDGTLRGIIDSAIAFLEGVPGMIGEALRGTGGFIWDNVAVPFITTVNTLITEFESFIKNILFALGNATAPIGTFLEGLSPGAGAPLFDAAVELGNAAIRFQIDRVSTARPGFLQAPGAAKGGVFGPGALRVHRGEELIASSARQLTVFPARVVRAMEAVAGIAPQPSSYVHPSVVNNSSNSYDNSRQYGDFIVNGIQSPQEWRREWAMTKAFR